MTVYCVIIQYTKRLKNRQEIVLVFRTKIDITWQNMALPVLKSYLYPVIFITSLQYANAIQLKFQQADLMMEMANRQLNSSMNSGELF